MSRADENRELLRQVTEASARSKDEMMQYFSPDARFYEPESLPYGGEYHGPERFAEFIDVFAATWSSITTEVIDVLASDTRATTFSVATFTSRATGKSATIPLCEVWEFADGKIVRVDAVYGDTVPILRALAAEPRIPPSEVGGDVWRCCRA